MAELPPFIWAPLEQPAVGLPPLFPMTNARLVAVDGSGNLDMTLPPNDYPDPDTSANDHYQKTKALGELEVFENGPDQVADVDVSFSGTKAKIPHPQSKFDHQDPSALVGTDIINHPDAGVRGPYRRLKMVHNWIVITIQGLLGELNQIVIDANGGVKKTTTRNFNTVRNEYINLLKNLDDHENPAIEVPKGLGYGLEIKWISVIPYIMQGVPAISGEVNANRVNLIFGAEIQIKWNPHSSSSGIPVEH